MKNLLAETIEVLSDNDKKPSDVLWVGSKDLYFSWDVFSALADKEYDDGYGGAEVAFDLIVVGEYKIVKVEGPNAE